VTAAVEPIGRVLIVVGLVIAAVGAVFVFGSRLPLLGHLPGDITVRRDGVTVFIPLGTMVLLSVVASVVLSIVGRR
jgi:Protein of unknown function (DUF2905)